MSASGKPFRRSPRRRTLLILALAFLACGSAPGVRAAGPVWEEQALMLRLNGVDALDTFMLLRDEAGHFWLAEQDFGRLRLNVPDGPGYDWEGHRFHALANIPGAQVDLDATHGVLSIELPAEAYVAQQLVAHGREADLPAESATGLFANYDLYGQRTGNATTGSAYTELGLFSGYGVVTSSSLMHAGSDSARMVRLDTTLTQDFPKSLQTLSVGDNVSDPGAWGSAVRFGGIRFARNFGIRPDLVTTPLLSAAGTAVVPSTVDVFMNNQKVLTREVEPGPFTIGELPAISGAGDVNIVVRDALGREVVLTQAFYSSPVMLAAGLSQYSFSAGSLRENYTEASFDYGSFMANGNLRRGITDRITVGGHVEYVAGQGHAAGADVATLLGNYGVGMATLAAGGDDKGTGVLGGLGFEHRGPRGGVAVAAYYATDGFRLAADIENRDYRMKFRGAAQASWTFGKAGSVSIAYAQRRFRDAPSEQTASLGYTVTLGRGTLSASLNRFLGVSSQTSGYATYTVSLGRQRSLETSAESVRSEQSEVHNEVRASVMQSAPMGEGHGWRLSAAASGNYDAWWLQRFSAAELELRAASNYGQSWQSVQLRGGATLMGGSLQASRRVDGSFALVDVAGIPGVPVYLENQLVAHTDEKGRALLPNLLSYDINRVTIEPKDLPLNTTIDSRLLEIRPAYRSGVVARFPVERTHPATLQLLQQDGTPVPTGAAVRLNGGSATVALRGITYVTTLDRAAAGIAEWQDGRCEFHVQPEATDDPLPDLGAIPCFAIDAAR